ncbi:hypothetical protein SDC9_146098 [bioreactor metagenome]|uniref:Uncharacterized protein n=1 Tax=bioreactor metagenome TaxID=1076179 RepID=A0A645ECT9_9ZZZZ
MDEAQPRDVFVLIRVLDFIPEPFGRCIVKTAFVRVIPQAEFAVQLFQVALPGFVRRRVFLLIAKRAENALEHLFRVIGKRLVLALVLFVEFIVIVIVIIVGILCIFFRFALPFRFARIPKCRHLRFQDHPEINFRSDP